MSELFTGTVRRWDVVLPGFQPIDNLFGGLLVRLFALRVQVGQDLDQTINTGLGTVRKSQHTPTNCWLLGIGSGYSSYYFEMRHIVSSISYLSTRHAGPVLPHVMGETGRMA